LCLLGLIWGECQGVCVVITGEYWPEVGCGRVKPSGATGWGRDLYEIFVS